ncbi:MAG TPA: hypothetical protein EYG92_10890 [Lutibacter sp.]|nr:hypothetical protein [Lutibacter sp.]
MKKIFFISVLLLVATISCKDTKKTAENKVSETETVQNIKDSEGYKLMEQKCFICHFPVPDGSRRDEMIAPPMLRVQEHYKPAYPNKADFVNAIKEWVKNPTEEKIQMPGASRKFETMPYLPYPDEEVQLIAETLFEIDFSAEFKGQGRGQGRGQGKAQGNGGHGRKQDLQLNNGEKWQLNKEAIANVNNIIKKLDAFKSDDVKAYQNLGKEVFQIAKTLILDKTIENQKFDQLQAFFHNIEDDTHELIQVKTVAEGQEKQEIIKKKFSKFFDFFE